MSVKMNKEAFQKLIDDDILGLHETMRAGCVRDHIENILKDSARVYYDLAEAIEAVYFAAHWHADRTVDAAALWTALRDAAEIQPGQTKARLGEDRLPGPKGGLEWLETQDFYELCQSYRHAQDVMPVAPGLPTAGEAFERLKLSIADAFCPPHATGIPQEKS